MTTSNRRFFLWPVLGYLALPGRCAENLPTKRGLAFVGDHAPDIQLLTSENSEISWYYTWSTWPAEQIGDALAFVPLLHGLDDANDDELENRLNRLPDSSTHLLTFNEPDGEEGDGGSSISPEDAAEAYLSNIVRLRDESSRKWQISHPSVTGSPRGLDWLRSFNESCFEIDDNGCPTDFVAVHWYGAFEGLEGWMQTLRDFYSELAPDAQYWITEVALPQADEQATLSMANQSLGYLDNNDDVQAYAWFGAFRTDEANEWTGDSVSFFNDDGELTELGAMYLGGEEKGFEEGTAGEGNDSQGTQRIPSFAISAFMVALSIYFSL
ncbi:Alkali-sensitive linkage protein [Paramyrothecium foliicola]|nr:Alkali-sensitive linkage protein [Paramyrothecium foliicola]